jgi:hypothetical protein
MRQSRRSASARRVRVRITRHRGATTAWLRRCSTFRRRGSGTDANRNQTFACGLLTAAEHNYWVPGTYGSVISDQGAYILLAGKNGTHAAVAFKQQP